MSDVAGWIFKCDYCGRAGQVHCSDLQLAIESAIDAGWAVMNCSPPNVACPDCKPKHTAIIFEEKRSDAANGPA